MTISSKSNYRVRLNILLQTILLSHNKTRGGEARLLPGRANFPAISYDLSKVRLNIGKGGYSLMLSLITRVTYLS